LKIGQKRFAIKTFVKTGREETVVEIKRKCKCKCAGRENDVREGTN